MEPRPSTRTRISKPPRGAPRVRAHERMYLHAYTQCLPLILSNSARQHLMQKPRPQHMTQTVIAKLASFPQDIDLAFAHVYIHAYTLCRDVA